jgi:hypothetical protein
MIATRKLRPVIRRNGTSANSLSIVIRLALIESTEHVLEAAKVLLWPSSNPDLCEAVVENDW